MKNYIFFAISLITLSCSVKNKEVYDIVIENARVIDPETKRDEILNVAITGDKITKISKNPLEGKTCINGTGKILSPGFIDLHAHGQSNKENEYQVFDGVTTALELEIGVDTLTGYFNARKERALINFGASACQLAYRNKAINGSDRVCPEIYQELTDSAALKVLPAEKFSEVRKRLTDALHQGAIGIGIPVGYLSAASIEEIADIYALAGKLQVPIFSHVREGGSIAFQQAISDAVLNQTQLHLCHITSMARKDIDFCLNQVEKAQALGFPITTELYPYTAGNTEISASIFNEGWQERFGCTYEDLQWVATGERLTLESFKKYRKQGGAVIVHMMKEDWVKKALKSDVTMIASDGDHINESSEHGHETPSGHPRSSGSFCRVLRKYTNEAQIISLKTAIKKMSLMPAKVIENVVPEMKLRGRIQEGCFADLLLFDIKNIKDNATFEHGFTKSSGMDYVIVNGTILIEGGKMKTNTFPGKAIKSEIKIQ